MAFRGKDACRKSLLKDFLRQLFSHRRSIELALSAALAIAMEPAAFAAQSIEGQDPELQIEELVQSGRLRDAEKILGAWMVDSPGDVQARTWHARFEAWANHWKEAENEYRGLLLVSPDDVDLLAGLANVLIWQNRLDEALGYLNRACTLDPNRIDCGVRRAQVLARLGRKGEARIAYKDVLSKDANSKDARQGFDELRERHHELTVGSDTDLPNYTENGFAWSAGLHSNWNKHWSTSSTFTRYRRFGEQPTRFGAETALRLGRSDTLTFGGAVADDKGIVPRAEALWEYGHGFHLSENGPVRGIETVFRQRWLWYQDARILALSPVAILYLPGDWNWLFSYSANRFGFSGAAYEWKPSGWSRLSFPVTGRVRGNLLFATGTENYGYIDQIGQYSMRTWGAGCQIRVASGQKILGYGQYQRRSGGQNMASFGASYAFEF